MVRMISATEFVGADGYDSHADGHGNLPDRKKRDKMSHQTSKTVPKTTSKDVTRPKTAKVELEAKDMLLD